MDNVISGVGSVVAPPVMLMAQVQFPIMADTFFLFFTIAILVFYIFCFLTILINNINCNTATFVVWN